MEDTDNRCCGIGHKEAKCWFKQEYAKNIRSEWYTVPNNVTFENGPKERAMFP